MTVAALETFLNADSQNQTRRTRYDFFSNLSENVRSALKNQSIPNPFPSGSNPGSAFLLAESVGSSFDSTIRHNGIAVDVSFSPNFVQVDSGKISPSQVATQHSSSTIEKSIVQPSVSQVSSSQASFTQVSPSQISPSQISPIQIGLSESSLSQISSAQINSRHEALGQVLTAEVYPAQIHPFGFSESNLISSEISNPTSIETKNFFISNPWLLGHNPNLQNITVPTWTEFLQSPTPFNLKIEIQDLPTGQLAEATITGYDINNRPNSGTLTLDTDGNNLGWFIDTTPDDNTEFNQTLTSTAFRATTGAASGKYDLLTTILHELGHLQGIISGNTAFDTHVQNINGIPTFIDGTTTAQLTPDGSHLDSTLYPYDLMNTSLKPGVRKLPSTLDLAILNTLWSNKPTIGQQINTTAHLTAGALIGITNGDFTTPTTWNTAGATNIINGTATLTEQSQKLSELTQAFIIPTGAKTLQFTIIDNHLVTGDTTKTANDAFEVALLDTNTFNPLAGTSIGLNHTDSLLNIQANGTIHKSDKVTITTLGNNSSIVTIDLTQVTPLKG